MKTRNWRQPDCIALQDRPKIPVEDTRLRALAWSHKHPSPFRKRTRKERGLDK